MVKILSSVLLVLALTGCSTDRMILREGMYQNMATIRQLAKDTGAKLVVDPATGKDHRDQIKSLTQAQYDQLLRTDAEFENLYQEDKARDFK